LNFKIILVEILVFPLLLQAQSKIPTEKKKNVNFAFIPIITYNRSFGMQFGALVNAYFDLNKNDTISPASTVNLVGNIFTNKTLFVGIFNKLYFDRDHWRTKFGVGYGDIRFQTYFDFDDVLPGLGVREENGQFIDYQTKVLFLYGEAARLIVGRLYLGLRLVYSDLTTEFDTEFIPNEYVKLFGFGIVSEYDIRDNVFTPYKGMNARIRTFSFLESLGSSNTYHKINFEYNKYFPLSDEPTILARFYGMVSVGSSIPFVGQNVIGRDDLRGYSDGKYRANQVYDIQGEYRWTFYKKFGMVAFGGFALATDDFSGTNYSGILPAIGAGLRYKAIPSRNINIGIDAAVGKGDWGLYFRIGEAFTR